MRYIFIFATLLLAFGGESYGQSINPAIDKDSLFREILKAAPEGMKADLQDQYMNGTEISKDFLLFMFSMPRSSKREMIANIDSNFVNITRLKTEYAKMVPKGYEVLIEFEAANVIIMTPESINLRITRKVDDNITVNQDWHMDYESEKLARMIASIGWTNADLSKVKELLKKANCVSIENGDITDIGFSRSGMGMYYFKLFEKDLDEKQIKEYNNGCSDIFYKKNIVLEYGSGAIGSMCFPASDKD